MQIQELGDYVGVESCVDLKPDVTDTRGGAGVGARSRWRRRDAAGKVYPPQISSLVRTENLSPHTPWVMKKYYTSDGRLVIKEEKVQRRECFLANRSNGRLVMSLVPLGDAVHEICEEHHAAGGEQEFDCVENVEVSGEEINVGDECTRDRTMEDAVSERCSYNRMGVNPCGCWLGLATTTAPFRPPLHT